MVVLGWRCPRWGGKKKAPVGEGPSFLALMAELEVIELPLGLVALGDDESVEVGWFADQPGKHHLGKDDDPLQSESVESDVNLP